MTSTLGINPLAMRLEQATSVAQAHLRLKYGERMRIVVAEQVDVVPAGAMWMNKELADIRNSKLLTAGRALPHWRFVFTDTDIERWVLWVAADGLVSNVLG